MIDRLCFSNPREYYLSAVLNKKKQIIHGCSRELSIRNHVIKYVQYFFFYSQRVLQNVQKISRARRDQTIKLTLISIVQMIDCWQWYTYTNCIKSDENEVGSWCTLNGWVGMAMSKNSMTCIDASTVSRPSLMHRVLTTSLCINRNTRHTQLNILACIKL